MEMADVRCREKTQCGLKSRGTLALPLLVSSPHSKEGMVKAHEQQRGIRDSVNFEGSYDSY